MLCWNAACSIRPDRTDARSVPVRLPGQDPQLQSGPQVQGEQVQPAFVQSVPGAPQEQPELQVQGEQVQLGFPQSAGFSVVALLIPLIVPQ